MKHTSRAMFTIFVAASVALAMSSCGTATNAGAPSGASGVQAHKQYVLGWSDPQGKQPIFQAFTSALEAASQRENIKVIHLDARLDVGKQVSDIQTFITQKVDAIVTFPLDTQAMSPALARAKAAGIKIIGYNALIGPPDNPPKVEAPFDVNVDMGYTRGATLSGAFVAKALHDEGNVIGLKLPAPVPSLIAMVDQYKVSVMTGHPDIKWLGIAPDNTDDLAGGNQGIADSITRNNGNIDAVMSYTDVAGIGAYQALKAAGKTAIITGQQGSQTGIDAVKADQIQADINVMPWMQAVWVTAVARDLIAGKTVPSFVNAPIQFVTKENVSEYVPWQDGIQQIKDGKVSSAIVYK